MNMFLTILFLPCNSESSNHSHQICRHRLGCLLRIRGGRPAGLAFPAGGTAEAHRPQGGKFGPVFSCCRRHYGVESMMALGADQKGFRGHPTHYYRR